MNIIALILIELSITSVSAMLGMISPPQQLATFLGFWGLFNFIYGCVILTINSEEKKK